MTTTTVPWTTDDRAVVRTPAGDRHALPGALISEWIKLSSLRANTVILAVSALVSAVIAGGLAATASASDPALPASELFIYPLPLVAMLAAVAGILMFTSEAQHGTLAVVLTARPARWVIVAAKTTTAAGVGLALGVTGMVAGFAGSVIGGAELGGGSHLVTRALWATLYIVLAALIGLGVGMIVRHTAAAITGLLMWSFVVESLFAPLLPDGVLHLLPFSAGYRLLDAGSQFEPPVVIADQLGRPAYALIFAGYAVVSLAVGTVLLYRRDAD
ncbi:ABC transporter permease subunit [Aquihabitans daechungensis]|uniref:ABC transporter permease subunit n=1 Tax=Aquihabitans daechungensis TaxID=1052257 RepID=UPI003B9F5997